MGEAKFEPSVRAVSHAGFRVSGFGFRIAGLVFKIHESLGYLLSADFELAWIFWTYGRGIETYKNEKM